MFLKRGFRKLFCYREKGFTLIELLIVIAVLGALAAVVVPNVSRFLGTANLVAANTEAMNVKTAALFCLANTGHYPLSSDELYGGDEVNYLSAKSDGTYTFDQTTGLITEAEPSETGITKDFVWDEDKQSWVSPP